MKGLYYICGAARLGKLCLNNSFLSYFSWLPLKSSRLSFGATTFVSFYTAEGFSDQMKNNVKHCTEHMNTWWRENKASCTDLGCILSWKSNFMRLISQYWKVAERKWRKRSNFLAEQPQGILKNKDPIAHTRKHWHIPVSINGQRTSLPCSHRAR